MASSRFGKDAVGLKALGTVWGIFPSLQASYVISNENWLAKVKGIDYLRFNAGIDITGNDDIDYTASRTYFIAKTMLTEEVNNVTASLVVAQLLFLEGQDATKDISLYINSPGGSVTDGMAIYDTMQYIKCDVSTICMGMAASMGAFLLAAGTKGKRYALPNSDIMIHQPSGGAQGQATDIMIHADHIIQTKKKLNTILAEKTGQPFDIIARDTERDNFMTAQQALEYGLIDKVITHR